MRRGPSTRALQDEKLRSKVFAVFELGRGVYGSIRIQQEFVDPGFQIERRRVARSMAEMGLVELSARAFQVTTDSNHAKPIAPNMFYRDFQTSQPSEKQVTDITYRWTAEGWMYLSEALDLYSRRAVDWSMSTSLETSRCLNAVSTALAHARIGS